VFALQVCRECRLGAAQLILSGEIKAAKEIWNVDDAFEAARMRFERHRNEWQGSPPRPEVLASVAQGLLEQGLPNEALLNAAGAVLLGEAADVNTVGASALEVLFDAQLQQNEFFERLRDALRSERAG
jgi:hypothetical protein